PSRLTGAPATSTLSLHDALPILAVAKPSNDASTRQSPQADEANLNSPRASVNVCATRAPVASTSRTSTRGSGAPSSSVMSPDTVDRKSTRLNSSHQIISYAVLCL